MTATQLAKSYSLTLAAIVKHLSVLEKARLVCTEKRGKERYARLSHEAVREATEYLRYYERFWNSQLDSLTRHLEQS
jgi:DNA-binding transcriptional ArsR family regulator